MVRDLQYGALGAPSDWNYQQVTNVEWPPEGIPARLPERQPVEVMARVVWDRDGEEWIPGRAVRWLRPVVFVLINDHRHRGAGVWLPVTDVRRAVEGCWGG